jgi:hypothetical protein
MAKIIKMHDCLSQRKHTSCVNEKLQTSIDKQAGSIQSTLQTLCEKANDPTHIRLMCMLSEYVNGVGLKCDNTIDADDVHARLELVQQLLSNPPPQLPPTGGHTKQHRRCLEQYKQASIWLEKCQKKMQDGLMDLCEMAQSGFVDLKQTLNTCNDVCQEALVNCLRVIYLINVHERLVSRSDPDTNEQDFGSRHQVSSGMGKKQQVKNDSKFPSKECLYSTIHNQQEQISQQQVCIHQLEARQTPFSPSLRDKWIKQRDHASCQKASMQHKRQALEVELRVDVTCKRRRLSLELASDHIVVCGQPQVKQAQNDKDAQHAIANQRFVDRLLEHNRNLEILLCERCTELYDLKHREACRELELLIC